MENCLKEEIELCVEVERVPRFKAGAAISKKVSRVDVSVKETPRFKAGADISGKVNLGVSVSHDVNDQEEVIALTLLLSEEGLQVPESEA